MRRISSRLTFVSKRVFPVFWFGFLAFIIFDALRQMIAKHEVHPEFLVIAALIAVMGFLIMKHQVLDLVDEVWDDGQALVVRSRGAEERIPLGNIINVGYSSSNPSRVTLTLREACPLGKEIAFSPPAKLIPFSPHPIISELITRIDDARRR